MSVHLIYKDIAVGAEDDACVSTTEVKNFSVPSQLPHGSDNVPLATLEPNSWILDGTRNILFQQKVSFWSQQMSGADGTFSMLPTITITFEKQYTSLGLSMTFDPATGGYCSQVTMRWYQGDDLLSEKVFYPNRVDYFCENTVEHYNKVVIQFDRTSLPFRYAKVSRIIFGIFRDFGLDELRSVNITQQIDLISATLPINKLDFTLDTETNVEYIFQRLQPMLAYDGETLIGVFFIDSSVRRSRNLYQVLSNDAVGVLDNEIIPAALYDHKNASELIEDILDGKFSLELDPALSSETLTGYIPSGTRRNALNQIAFALRAVVDTSGSEAVRVYRPPASSSAIIPLSRTYMGGNVETKAVVTAVRVTAHSYSTSGNGDAVEVDGVTYYDTKTVITINNPDVTASDKQNVIEISAATLVNPSNVGTVAQYAYDYYMRRSSHNVKIVVSREKPGDYVTTYTPWGTEISGNIVSMYITLSGITAAECNVIGT